MKETTTLMITCHWLDSMLIASGVLADVLESVVFFCLLIEIHSYFFLKKKQKKKQKTVDDH
jgi:hypothetical protein